MPKTKPTLFETFPARKAKLNQSQLALYNKIVGDVCRHKGYYLPPEDLMEWALAQASEYDPANPGPLWVRDVDYMPPTTLEVLVWIDGKRGPSWSNSYAKVAYLGIDGQWYEHDGGEPLQGVTHWRLINGPAKVES